MSQTIFELLGCNDQGQPKKQKGHATAVIAKADSN